MESLREQKKRLSQNTAEETVTYKKKNLFRPFKIILIVSIILYLFGLLYGNIFAEKIGKSVNFMSQVEGTGTVRGVSLETLFKMADVLGIPPSKLLEDD